MKQYKTTATAGSVIDLLSALIQDGELETDSPLTLGIIEQENVILYVLDNIIVPNMIMGEPSMAILMSAPKVQHIGRTPDAPAIS